MATYSLISSVTLSSAGTQIEFTSIPNTYTDLVLKHSMRTSGDTRLRFNGSTSSYSERLLYGQGASAASASNGGSGGWLEWAALANNPVGTSIFGNSEIYIPNYAGSNNKSSLSDNITENSSATGNNIYLDAGLWANSAAITSILIYASSGTFAQYSSAYLYGISNA